MEEGAVIAGRHFRDELANEGISMVDAWGILRCGHIFSPPEPDIKTGEWKYRIEGHEPGGKWMAIVFSFKTEDNAFLITIFSVRSKQGR
ncbi:MAG: hypothetical protein A3F68_06785 [Acidobacteria bacterium RIFCSPLOWO2_12_FULL_54_10]|nr:MAG: hypothetical protein A3F68_06785 [Acidobacteria bacterium RIFCSPLOWO2_12_FULL_54_10]